MTRRRSCEHCDGQERNKLTYDEALLRHNAQMARLAKQDERIAQLRADGKRIVGIHNDDDMDRFRVIIGELVQQALAAQPAGP